MNGWSAENEKGYNVIIVGANYDIISKGAYPKIIKY